MSDQDSSQVSRIERRKKEFRDRITQAALKLFEKQGVADTSVAAIIKEADIAHKTFFNHFPTKDHLLEYIASSFGGNAYDVFKEGLRELDDPRKRLEYTLVNVARALEAVNPNYKELLNFYLISGTGAHDLRQQQKDQFSGVIHQIIVDAHKRGMLKPGSSVETYTDIIVGICVSTMLNWSLEDDYPLVNKMKKAVAFIDNSVFT
jgi:AcrR family transcriptional regulator